MSHLDEGQLHALLDGELDEAERKTVEAHLESCAECRREFAEARALMAGADELIAAVELPASTRPAAVAPRPKPPLFRWRSVAWAASVCLAVGLGYLARAADFQERYAQPASTPVADAAPAPSLFDSQPAKQELEEKTGAMNRRVAANGPADQKIVLQAPVEPARRDEALASAKREGDTKPKAAASAVAKEAESAAPTDGLRALTNQTGKDAEDARSNDAIAVPAPAPAPGEEGRLASKPAPAQPAAPPRQPQVTTAERARKELSGQGAFAPAAAGAGAQFREVTAFQPTPMEAAVRILGGSIRLVDGMTPVRVLVGPGILVSGADSGLEIVRVVYNDPPGRELWLDQQRPRPGENEQDKLGKTATTLLPGDTLVVNYPAGQKGLRWIHQTGFRLGLTGFLPADSLRSLARRVQ